VVKCLYYECTLLTLFRLYNINEQCDFLEPRSFFSEGCVGLMGCFGFVFVYILVEADILSEVTHPERKRIWCWLTDQIISDSCNKVTQTAAAARVRLQKYPSSCGNRTSFYLYITLFYRSYIWLSVIFHRQQWLYTSCLEGIAVCVRNGNHSVDGIFL
jgi:hypothetical protein